MKYLSIIKYVFLATSALVVALFFLGATEVDLMLYWAYALLGLTVAAVILLPLINVIKNPAGAMRSLVGLVIVAIVLGVSYALASDTPIPKSAGGFFENSTELKLSDMGLYATYFAMGATILIVIGGEIKNIFK